MRTPDYFDRYDADEQPEEGQRQPKCNRCGSTDVRWRHTGEKWLLFSLKPGVLHSCNVTDDFEASE